MNIYSFKNVLIWLTISIIFSLFLYYFYVHLRTISQHWKPQIKAITKYVFLTGGVVYIACLLTLPYVLQGRSAQSINFYYISILIALSLGLILSNLIFLIDDLRRGAVYIFQAVRHNPSTRENGISRSIFLSWLGIGLGGGLVGLFIHGFGNKYNYTLKKVSIPFPNLPNAFKGLKIIQISDIHTGSLKNKKLVEKGIDMILEQKPDIIFFTGDIVNDFYEELQPYEELLGKLSAPMGIYSILGNHDYGDYTKWASKTAKEENLKKIIEAEKKMGWNLLMNEHFVLKKGEDSIAILGVENWSVKSNFPKYGKLDEAYKGTEPYPFKILLSHDPSQWDAQVRPLYPSIDLTLSGHTHGMQFGVNSPFLKWSPIEYAYKQWMGLYQEGNQYIYVNPGFGFLGYPGRIGILPEITLIELV